MLLRLEHDEAYWYEEYSLFCIISTLTLRIAGPKFLHSAMIYLR